MRGRYRDPVAPRGQPVSSLWFSDARRSDQAGHIFVGDVRSLSGTRPFTSVQLARAPDTAPGDLRQALLSASQHDEELVLDPALFHHLVRQSDKLGRPETSLKAGAS